MQCCIFKKQTLSISSQRVLWPCWIFNAEDGQRDRDTFPNRVGDRWKKEWEGRRKRKCFLHVPSLQPNLSKPNSNMVAQWMILSSLVRCLCWKKVFGVFVKCLPSHKKRQSLCDKVSWIFLSELDSSANALHYFLTCSAPVISSSWKLFVK